MAEIQVYSGIGLMSGTSLDGLDMAFCKFFRDGDQWLFKIEKSETQSFPKELSVQLSHSKASDERELKSLDLEFGKWIGKETLSFCQRNALNPQFISSHGHTVKHNPDEGYTIQIGNGQIVADITGIRVINDFRSQDIHLGGQGAPLVPIGDLHLFNKFKYCLNLGGIANISVKNEKRIAAYDICSCNTGLNHFAQIFNQPYDKDGELGRMGRVDQKCLDELNEIEYFNQNPPKSLDASFFESEILKILEKSKVRVEDQLTTLYYHIADQVARSVDSSKSEILVTGGGAFNKYLIELIQERVGPKIVIPENTIIEFKEALIFAYLGLLHILKENNVLAEVTGSRKDHCSGKSWFPT